MSPAEAEAYGHLREYLLYRARAASIPADKHFTYAIQVRFTLDGTTVHLLGESFVPAMNTSIRTARAALTTRRCEYRFKRLAQGFGETEIAQEVFCGLEPGHPMPHRP